MAEILFLLSQVDSWPKALVLAAIIFAFIAILWIIKE